MNNARDIPVQQPLFPDLQPQQLEDINPVFDIGERPVGPAKPGDYLFMRFKAGFSGLFMISPIDINAALEDWKNPQPAVLMVVPTPMHPGVSGHAADSEEQMLAMTIIDKRMLEDIQHVPASELQQFSEEYERDHPNELGDTV